MVSDVTHWLPSVTPWDVIIEVGPRVVKSSFITHLRPMTLIPRTPRQPDRGLGPAQDGRASYQLVCFNLPIHLGITRQPEKLVSVWSDRASVCMSNLRNCSYLLLACKVIFGECDGNLSRHWHHHSPHMKSLLLWLVVVGTTGLSNSVEIVCLMTE